MRCLLATLALFLLACTPTESTSAAPKGPVKSTTAAPSGDYLATQLAGEDRSDKPVDGQPGGDPTPADAAHGAVDLAARTAGLEARLAGDQPAVSPTHRMLELHELGLLGRETTYRIAGDHRIAGIWELKDGQLDMRFELFDGKKRTEDAWLACTWAEAADVVTLVCGMAKATEFGTTAYGIERAGKRWTLSLKDQADARSDNWPLRMVVEAI